MAPGTWYETITTEEWIILSAYLEPDYSAEKSKGIE